MNTINLNWVRIGDTLCNLSTYEKVPCKHPHVMFWFDCLILNLPSKPGISLEISYKELKHIDTKVAYLLYSDNDNL